MDKIIEFFSNLYHEHFYVIVIAVILFSVLIVTTIVLSQIHKTKKEDEMFKKNAENAVSSLTQEEIDNISQNVADKETLYELLSKPTKTKKEDKKVQPNSDTETKIVKEEVSKEVPTNKEVDSPTKPTQTKKKTATKKSTQQTKTTREYTGKWKIKKLENKYFAELTASNGGTLLKTESYTTLTGLKNGIETLKKNIEAGNIAISLDKYSHYHYKIFTSTNRLLCVSEDYSSKAKCENGISSVKRFSKSSTIIMEDN
ncbi:MAG: DUF1508 domain-containing protein [Clostridia bacterium]|nr:DUF1508 domain-containing protein [Clostridia bacterium]